MKRMYDRQPDGHYALAVWFHESDFADERSPTADESDLAGPTYHGTVTLADGEVRPAVLAEGGRHAVVEEPDRDEAGDEGE